MDNTTKRLNHLIEKAKDKYSENYLVIVAPIALSKKFIAYCAMKEDLQLVLQYISELRKNPQKVIKSALSYSLIALYGKCFTDASKNSFPKLEPTELFKEANSNLDTHNYLMELRHQFIAHRGKTENEVGISFLLVPKKGPLDITEVRFSQLKMVGFSNKDLDRFETLTNFIIEKLIDKIQKSGQKVQDGMLNLFTSKQLTFLTINDTD